MQQQRTVITKPVDSDQPTHGMVTVAAFGQQLRSLPGRSVADTIEELGLQPQPYQSVRVGGEKVEDLKTRVLMIGEIVTITNQVRGG